MIFYILIYQMTRYAGIIYPLLKLLIDHEMKKLHNNQICLCEECEDRIFGEVLKYSYNIPIHYMNSYIVCVCDAILYQMMYANLLEHFQKQLKLDESTILLNRNVKDQNFEYFSQLNKELFETLIQDSIPILYYSLD
jgi:hypothetical protein